MTEYHNEIAEAVRSEEWPKIGMRMPLTSDYLFRVFTGEGAIGGADLFDFPQISIDMVVSDMKDLKHAKLFNRMGYIRHCITLIIDHLASDIWDFTHDKYGDLCNKDLDRMIDAIGRTDSGGSIHQKAIDYAQIEKSCWGCFKGDEKWVQYEYFYKGYLMEIYYRAFEIAHGEEVVCLDEYGEVFSYGEQKDHDYTRKTGFSSVYVIGQKAGPYKIGIATDLKGRLSALQTGSHMNIQLLYSSKKVPYDEAAKAEKMLHTQYKNVRIRGEWFNVSNVYRLGEQVQGLFKNDKPPK